MGPPGVNQVDEEIDGAGNVVGRQEVLQQENIIRDGEEQVQPGVIRFQGGGYSHIPLIILQVACQLIVETVCTPHDHPGKYEENPL